MTDNKVNNHDQQTITDTNLLQQSLFQGLNSWVSSRGEIAFPCVPSLLENYMQRIEALFLALGKPFSPAELNQIRPILTEKLQEGFQASPYSKVLFRYESAKPPGRGVSCQIITQIISIAEQCDNLTQTHSGLIFGEYPDAKVMAIADSLNPTNSPVLEIGAGTGRNALSLARLGFSIHALDLSGNFVEQLQRSAAAEKLPIQAMQGDFLDPLIKMRHSYYKLGFLASVVPHFREVSQVRLLFAKMSDVLCSGGLLLFSAFLAAPGYNPSKVDREMAHVIDSFFLTRTELAAVMENLPLDLISDESVYEYEKKHLPTTAWPLPDWFNNWATGQRLFPLKNGKSPIELRWILCRRF